MSSERFSLPSEKEKNRGENISDSDLVTEDEAWNLIECLEDPDCLKSHPEYRVLIENEKNRAFILEDNISVTKRYQYAMEILRARGNAISYEVLGPRAGYTALESVSVSGLERLVQHIKSHQYELGEGEHARVVADMCDVGSGHEEVVCYKFMKTAVIRERPWHNSLRDEASMQLDFHEFVQSSDLRVGIPEPYYYLSVAGDEVLVMENIHAVSLADIRSGKKGFLPKWFNASFVRHELEKFIEQSHSSGLYHRDLHTGNVLIPQTHEVPEDTTPFFYIIDFGLSGRKILEENPYRFERGNEVWTYRNDRGIVNEFTN